MDYKYKKWQIFGKRLNVPKDILKKIYNSSLSFEEYVNYELIDKIPTSCITEKERLIVEKFGIEMTKKFDWELIKMFRNPKCQIDILATILSFYPFEENINNILYDMLKNEIPPSEYPENMKKYYSDRIVDITQLSTEKEISLAKSFNCGEISLSEIIRNWHLFRRKDLSYCLGKMSRDSEKITSKQVKDFMTKYEILANVIVDYTSIDKFIEDIRILELLDDPKVLNDYIRVTTDIVLKSLHENEELGKLSNKELQEIFKYSSIRKYFINMDEEYISLIEEELKSYPNYFLENMSIPFEMLKKDEVKKFVSIFGLKNIVDFDNECEHFLSKNNCEMLMLMYELIENHTADYTDSLRNAYKSNGIDGNKYTKEQFYESFRRLLIYKLPNNNFDYRELSGKFKERYLELFILEDAPEELKNAFYKREITFEMIAKHPEYVPFLKGKNLTACFVQLPIIIQDKTGKNEYLELCELLQNIDFNTTIEFIKENIDVISIIFYKKNFMEQYLTLSYDDDLEKIEKKMYEKLKEKLIEDRINFPAKIPDNFKKYYPELVMDEKAPQELKDAFYSRTLKDNLLIYNQDYHKYLKSLSLEVIFDHMTVTTTNNGIFLSKESLVKAFEHHFSQEEILNIMLLYNSYFEEIYKINKLKDFTYDISLSKGELLDEIDDTIYKAIIRGNIIYDENISKHFKENYPKLFLGAEVGLEIRNKFYSRNFSLKDFDENSNLLTILKDTNISCGFPTEFAWTIQLFSNQENQEKANLHRLKIISEYDKIEDINMKKVFKDYVIECGDSISVDKLQTLTEIIIRLSRSNSSEMVSFKKQLADQILKTDNPLETLNKIEEIFIQNNVPVVGKIYSCFELLHPNLEGFDFDESKISPVLKNLTTSGRKATIFADLIKASFGSNNRSLSDYLENVERGYNLYRHMEETQIKYEELNEAEKKEIIKFSKCLITLYNNTQKGKSIEDYYKITSSPIQDIAEMIKRLSPNGTLDYNVPDRIIRMFCGIAGINTLQEAKSTMKEKVIATDSRNRESATKVFVLEKGDFIKGIGSVGYLRNIFQNGSVAKEFLGEYSNSDRTPLDTDMSMILMEDGTISEKLSSVAASDYGQIWFVLKNDERFIISRTKTESFNAKRDLSKIEVFYTGEVGDDHYGIRTGFASSEINYILMDDYDSRVGLEIAMNGFYIPIVNKEGKVIFTPQEYDVIRSKMSGLSYYGENNYNFSQNIISPNVEEIVFQLEESIVEVTTKRKKINNVVEEVLGEFGLHLKTTIDEDLTEGYVEFIDTGSTGRNTNMLHDGDFDFVMRFDRNIISDEEKMEKIRKSLLERLGKLNTNEVTGDGDFRLERVCLDEETIIDVDITFMERSDKVTYSTDMALKDRLETIKRDDPEKYNYVVANIILAKQVLKEAGAYKPNRGKNRQGGLGGVGVENWILQNGGSFIDAAESFLKAAEGKEFESFKKVYQIWNFGDNFLAARRENYPHDNYVAENMSQEGYDKMVNALKEYLLNNKKSQTM